MKYSVGLIGLGKIGMGYDFALDSDQFTLTHARAFARHKDFSLIGAVDPNGDYRRKFKEKYSVPAYETIEDFCEDISPDILVVACPTEFHKEVIEKSLKVIKPRVILCEKPLAYNSDDAKKIYQMCKDFNIALYLNYVRRADPVINEIKNKIINGVIAGPYKVIVWYSKGLMHNGSHFIDLLNFWFGGLGSLQIINNGRSYGGQDGEPDFSMSFNKGLAIFLATKDENFSHFSVEILASNGRLYFGSNGMYTWQGICRHPQLSDHIQLDATKEEIMVGSSHYQYHVVNQLHNILSNLPSSLCNGDDGLKGVLLIESILKSRKND
jgi:predicted dehydrogenase